MKISRLYLKNVRCFDELEIDFKKPGSSILVIGENGDGKSSVLRSLAMGLCDQSSASALFRELPGEFVRHGAEKAGTRIEVDLNAGSYNYRIVTKIKSLETFERVEQEHYRWRGQSGKPEPIDQDDFPWHNIFASGYGAGIRVQGTADFEYYLTADAVYPLFRYDTPLQNPELIVRRLVEQARNKRGNPAANEKKMLGDVKRLLAGLLDLDEEDQLELTLTGITIRGRWGTASLSSLGDGYRSVVTWVLDMIAWWFLKQQQEEKDGVPTRVSGIVVVDEVEQHLHPRWQRNIVSRLVSSFPDVQFVLTTHSPLVASGCENVAVHKLDSGAHTVESPYGWLAEDVYRMMGLLKGTRSRSFRTEVLDEFRELDQKRLRKTASRSELARLAELERRLNELPETDPVRLTSVMENIQDLLNDDQG